MEKCGTPGVFLFFHSTLVILLQGESSYPWGSLYVDEHGEEDENFSRGKELRLSPVRFAALRTILLQQTVTAHCRRSVSSAM